MKLKSKEERKGEKIFRYSIRKYHFGAASVAVAALMFFANGTVQAQTPDISPATESGTTRTSALVSDSSGGGGVSEELSEETPDTDPSQPEQPIQGNRENQEASDKNKSLVKDSEEGKGEKQAEEASRPTVDKSLAESAQTSLQALLANLTLDSMKELHARVEAGLAQAKAVLENPNSSQEEVNAQVQAMKTLTEEVNKALAGGLTSPAELGEGSGVTQSEPSPTPRRGRGRRGQLTPPTAPVSTENQETKERAEEVTDYTNGPGSYPLSEKIHKLLQELNTSTENPEQVQKLKEAYDKLNEALQTKEDGLVDQEVFNAALEEYKKASQLEKGAKEAEKSRSRRSVSGLVYGLATGSDGKEIRARDSSGRERDIRNLFNGEDLNVLALKYIATVETGTIRDISISGFPTVGNNGKTWATITKRIDNNGKRAVITIRGKSPKELSGVYNTTLTVVEGSSHVSSKTQTILYQLPKPTFDGSYTDPGKSSQEAVEGKAEEKPMLRGRIAVPPGGLTSSNIVNNSELRMFLVRGGHNDSFNGVETGAEGFDIVAWGRVGSDGTVPFYPTQYQKPSIGDAPLRLVVAYVKPGTNQIINQDLVSPLSNETIRPTYPIDRDGANGELDAAANTKNTSIETTPNLTAEEIADAKRKVGEALADAKDKVNKARNKADVDQAKQAGLDAINNINPTATTHDSAISKLDETANTKNTSIETTPN
ncbi:DUF1542 domain-containing protein, partial [Streptococcus sp. 2579]|uniref:DUF1542 domain-containing protein n=3 Tax=unclassified Streptococcus TaxID=2608887 RepID=UPI0015674C53